MVALKLNWVKIRISSFSKSQRGSALVPVLGVITVSAIGILIAFQFSVQSQKYGFKDLHKKSAMYIAESGIADALYQYKYGDSSQSSESDILELGEEDSSSVEIKAYPFILNPELDIAEIEIEEDENFLTIHSKGKFKSESANIEAVFGKTLSDSLLRAALILTGQEALMDLFPDQVEGNIYTKVPPAVGIMNFRKLDSKWSLASLTGEFVSNLNQYYHNELQVQLSSEHGEIGNGYFSPSNPPAFENKESISFPLGDVSFENYQSDCWEIEAEGSIFANGDVYIKGCVRIKGLNVVAGRTVQANDELQLIEGTIYSEGNMYIAGKSHIAGTLFSEKSIYFEEEANSTMEAVIISSGKETGLNKLGEKVPGEVKLPNEFGIYAKEEVVLRGLVIAAGNHGKIELNNSEAINEGYFLSNGQMEIAGELHGLVITSQLRCSENEKENCLGDGKISRFQLTQEIALPMAFGGGDMESFQYKIISWKME